MHELIVSTGLLRMSTTSFFQVKTPFQDICNYILTEQYNTTLLIHEGNLVWA